MVFGDVQISVPASWDIATGCPTGVGNVYLGSTPRLFCQNEPVGTDIVVLGNARTASSPYGSPAVINHIPVQWLDPGDTIMQIPSLDASVSAKGPSGAEVLHTVTYSPRAVTIALGTSPPVPGSWHRVSFGGLSAAVPSNWAIDRRADWPVACAPTHPFSLSKQGVLLSEGTSVFPPACPAPSYPSVRIPTPFDGLVIDPGPDGPISAGASSFGSCLRKHGLRLCPTTSDPYNILVLSVDLPGTSRPTAVEIGLAGSGLTARTILRSLRPN